MRYPEGGQGGRSRKATRASRPRERRPVAEAARGLLRARQRAPARARDRWPERTVWRTRSASGLLGARERRLRPVGDQHLLARPRPHHKVPVMAMVNVANLKQAIRDNVQAGAQLHTDAHFGYRGLAGEFQHHSVKHMAGEYSRHEGENVITTAGVESFFSLLKRGVVGTFHHVSAQHLPLYLAEFEHRHNCRKMTDGERTDVGLTKAVGKRLIYKTA